MKFEKQTRHVFYVEKDDVYRVTFDTVDSKERTKRDPLRHLVGIAAAISYWDGVDKRSHCLCCARTVKYAWDAGDRYLLDTDEARKAAELVSDISDTVPDENDICSALSDLYNEIAKVRMSDTEVSDFETEDITERAIRKCFSIEDFSSWSSQAQRRRFMYELCRKDRTPVVYTLMGLYFGYGQTPLLTSRQRQELISIDRGNGVEGAIRFFAECIRKMTEYRFS